MAFQFKQFFVEDSKCSMKVGTDAVILGAWAETSDEKSMLDIGTGSGVIALMMAQKCNANIDAIDFDLKSIEQAASNFKNSSWSKRLHAIHSSLQDYVKNKSKKYNLIISNPPFFENSLKSPIRDKNISKHTDWLKFNELALGIKLLLHPKGSACIILPPNETTLFLSDARVEGMHCNKRLNIIPVIGKECNRVILKISHIRSEIIENELSIRDKNRNFTNEYIELTKDFYLKF